MSSESLSAVTSMMQQMSRSVIGQEEAVRTLTLALLCNGNVLLEGLPGTAKTRSRRGWDASSSRRTCCRRMSPAMRCTRTTRVSPN